MGETATDILNILSETAVKYNNVLNYSDALHKSFILQKQQTPKDTLTFDDYKKLVLSYRDSFKATIKLILSVCRLGLEYVSVDMERVPRAILEQTENNARTIEIRDKFMINKISEACTKLQKGAVLLVGIDHIGIETGLRDKGFKVLSFYTPSKTFKTTSPTELKVRNGDMEFARESRHSVHVIDKVRNSNIDAVRVCMSIINRFMNPIQMESLESVNVSTSLLHKAVALKNQADVVKLIESVGGIAAMTLANPNVTAENCCPKIVIHCAMPAVPGLDHSSNRTCALTMSRGDL